MYRSAIGHALGLYELGSAGYAHGMARAQPSVPAIQALAYLLELAAREAGYRVRGVRGWATARVIEKAVGLWNAPELMRAQVDSGRVLRVDVRAAGESKPVWVYRVSRKGIDVLAAALGVTPVAIPEPQSAPEGGVYLRDGVAAALQGLRSAAADPRVRAREWIEGQSGWRSSWELTRIIENEDEEAGRSPGRSFLSEDLGWLVRLGLADKRVVGTTHVYRLTACGAAICVLTWAGPR